MGGRGSGRHASFGLMVDKCHEMHSIDLAWLRRRKLLKPGHWSTVRWSRRGQETGSIQIASVPAGVLLSYRQRTHGDDWQDVREVVPLIETATHFGGRRQWFECLYAIAVVASSTAAPTSVAAAVSTSGTTPSTSPRLRAPPRVHSRSASGLPAKAASMTRFRPSRRECIGGRMSGCSGKRSSCRAPGQLGSWRSGRCSNDRRTIDVSSYRR